MAFLLTVDGLQYALGTQGVTTFPTSTDSMWTTGLTLLQGALVTPRGTITERARPLDGDLDVGGLTFEIREVTAPSGEASGLPWMTCLATRRASTLIHTQLLASSGTLGTTDPCTINVDSTAAFPSSGDAYIDRETVTYTGKTATTLTGCTRGKYGSRNTQHIVDAASSLTPIVWGNWPGFEGRRVVLWYVDGDMVASCLWIGTIRNGPSLIDGDKPESGAMWSLQCEHIWNAEKEIRLGANGVAVNLTGFNAGSLTCSVDPSDGNVFGSGSLRSGSDPLGETPQRSRDAAIQFHRNQLVANAPAWCSAQLVSDADSVTLSVRVTKANGVLGVWWPPVHAGITWGNLRASGAFGWRSVQDESRQANDTRTVEVTLGGIPRVAIWVPTFGTLTTTQPVDNVSALPAAWTPASGGDATYLTTTQYVLTAEMDDRRLVLEPTATASAPATVTGLIREVSFTTGRDIERTGYEAYGGYYIADPPTLRLMARITSTRWLDTIRYGITAQNDVVNPVASVDARNWDWTNADRILALTDSDSSSTRVLYLDGSRSVGELLADQFKFQGVGLGIRSGRVCPFVFLPPVATDTPSASLTTADLLSKSTWGRNPDGIVNSVKIETDGGSLVINDQYSVARFGQSRQVSMGLTGSDDRRTSVSNPSDLVAQVFRRFLGLWNVPTFVRKVRVSLSRMASLWIGDYVTLTEWLTPDGAGSRGPTACTGQIIGKSIVLGAQGYVELELLEYGVQYVYGFSPCVTVTDITAAVLTVENASAAWTGSVCSDYAGSNLAGYSGTANDGGASLFVAGDKVKLIKRNVTTVVQETGLTVLSVSPSGTPGASTITLTTSPTTVVGTDYWDLVYDDYGNGTVLQAGQKLYAVVGDGTTRVIGTSTDPTMGWAP